MAQRREALSALVGGIAHDFNNIIGVIASNARVAEIEVERGVDPRESLRDMLSLCAHFAPHVVVDGIERDDDLHIASQAGAQWMQGFGVRGAERYARVGSPVGGDACGRTEAD